MSSLARARPRDQGPLCSLSVYSNGDAEIQLFDARLEKLVHSIADIPEVKLPAGLYKIRVVHGREIVEKLIDLRSDERVFLRVDSTPSVAPLWPIYQNDSVKIEQFAEKAIDRSGVRSPDAGTILLLAHRSHPADRDPLKGVSLRRWSKRRERAANDRGPILTDVIAKESWSAWASHADPGMWELQLVSGLRQIIPVVPGWETRVFIRRTREQAAKEAESTDKEVRPRVVTEVSVQMAHPEANVVYSDHFETIEVARKALELERPIFAGTRLINELLHGKWDNPLMGITGTHLMLAALERDDREAEAGRPQAFSESDRARAPELLKTVLANLEQLVGSYCRSDLAALHIRARPFVDVAFNLDAIDAPPIYWSSWRILMGQEMSTDYVQIPRFVWSRVSRARPIGPYFSWQAGRVSVDREVRDILFKEANIALPTIQATAEPDDVRWAGAASSTTPAINTLDLAQVLGAPTSLVDDSISRLRGVLDPDKNGIIG